MNKKQYIQPNIEVIHLNMEQGLLAGSMGSDSRPILDFTNVADDNTGYYAD